MALTKKNGFWWIDITFSDQRIRRSTRTKVKQQAQVFHDNFLQDLWNNKHTKSQQQKSWMDAVVRWLEESAHKRSLVTDKFHLTFLDSYLGQKMLDDIDSDLIEFIAQEKENTGVTLTTVNRMLEIIRAILNREASNSSRTAYNSLLQRSAVTAGTRFGHRRKLTILF